MRLVVVLAALVALVACRPVAGSAPNATEPERHGDPGHRESEAREGDAVSGPDYEEDEEYEEVLPVHQYIVDDLIRVEPVVKPKPTKRGGEKNAGKSRRKKNKGKNKKKGTPCEMEYKNFCIHGECIYLEHLQMVTCKCHQDFFGERCGEQFMKTQKKNDVADYSKTVLVVVAVLLSSISFITVLIIVIVQVRKKMQNDSDVATAKLRGTSGYLTHPLGHCGWELLPLSPDSSRQRLLQGDVNMPLAAESLAGEDSYHYILA
ncbi:amphiregulin [Patagioenas fasciata monilis]|uniref:Amphiregulin n=1 Tax=Patagioenas fasciata monilis TaxID=372326 RepID=A0A1V4JV16_PATFA|nr:amphiregulin [Patagioenas fasciata monilis]